MRVHPAGKRMILVPLAVGAALVAAAVPGPRWLDWASLPFFAAGLFLLWFFRDPERGSAAGPGAVLAAADGRVIQVKPLEHCAELGGPATLVSVFMSPLDVHVNRASVAGRAVAVDYRSGDYLMAFHEKASELNEACLLTLEDGQGRRVGLRQIAGFLARRVVCPVQPARASSGASATG